ncbi:MAG: RluA family pseudouridine synthase [Chloroflexota bacterium]|nr:RluA family pseudouridine synthase [Chloroflexota bacterium]
MQSEFQRKPVTQKVRLGVFLVNLWPHLTKPAIEQLIADEKVQINEQTARKAGQYLHPGDVVATIPPVSLPKPAKPLLPPPLPMALLYEDDTLLVVEKPAGMFTHAPYQDQVGNSLSYQLQQRYSELSHVGGIDRAGILQRMDKNVSGPLLVARNNESYRALKHDIKRRRVEQTYSALVIGHLKGQDTITAPIGDSKRGRGIRRVVNAGRPVSTSYQVQRHYSSAGEAYTLLILEPDAARLHQMRVHLSWLGYPIVGDTVYGPHRQPILSDRLFLHLSVLNFYHPFAEERVRIESALPEALDSILRYMTRPKYLR